MTYGSGSCPRSGMPLGRAMNIVIVILILNCYYIPTKHRKLRIEIDIIWLFMLLWMFGDFRWIAISAGENL